MKLLLRAFGQSKELSLRERAKTILEVQQEVSSILCRQEWTLLNKKTVTINIQDQEDSYPLIVSQVKKGLNAKVAKPIRYKEEDIADISSRCNFYEKKDLKGIVVNYLIGYPAKAFHGFMFGIENINEFSILSKKDIDQIIKLIILRFNPLFLSLVDYNYFHNVSKASEYNIPWTGCLTYISNEVTNIDFPEIFRIESIESLGKLIDTSKEDIDETYTLDNRLALDLEKFLIENNITVKK